MQLAGEAGSLLKIEEEIRDAIAETKRLWQAGPKLEQATLFDEAAPAPQQKEMKLDLSGITDGQFWERAEEQVYAKLRDYAEWAESSGGFQRRLFAEDAARGFAFIDLCLKRYDVALMNPPFGDASLPSKPYLDETYGDTKGDVYKAFVECFHARLIPAGYLGIISSRTGFFLGQSEDWRTRVVLRLFRPIALADLGSGVLDAMVEVAAYVLRNLSEPEARDLTHSIVPVLGKVVRDSQDRFSLPKWQAARGGLKRHQAAAELEHLEAHGFIQRGSGDTVRYTPLWHEVKKVTAPPEPVFPPLVCVRALDEKDKGAILLASLSDSSHSKRFVCDPAGFKTIPGTRFAYWATARVRQMFSKLPTVEQDERNVRIGDHPSDDFRWLRLFWEPPAVQTTSGWKPYQKGGSFSRYYADIHLLVDWDASRTTYRGFIGRVGRSSERPSNFEFYFQPGITWPRRSQKGASFRVLPAGCAFSDKGPSVSFKSLISTEILAVLALLNSEPFRGLIALQIAFGSYEVGAIQQTVLPILDASSSQRLAVPARAAWETKRTPDTAVEASHAFIFPALLAASGSTLAERAAAWAARVRKGEETVAAIQAEIDDLAFRLYGLDAADRAALTATLVSESTSITDKSGSTATKPSDSLAKPPDSTATSTDSIARPTDNISRPTDNISRPTDNISRPTDSTARSTDNTDSPTDSIASPTDNIDSPTDSIASPTDNIDSPTDGIDSPTDSIVRSTDSIASPTGSTATSTDSTVRPTGNIADLTGSHDHLMACSAKSAAPCAAPLVRSADVGSDNDAGEDSDDSDHASTDVSALTADLLAYALGSALGRWDIRYATGEKAAPEPPDPFAPLPVCPPGQLQNAQGLPVGKDEVRRLKAEGRWTYPIEIPWDGILVDDPNHPLDLERRVREVLEIIWGGSSRGNEAQTSPPKAVQSLLTSAATKAPSAANVSPSPPSEGGEGRGEVGPPTPKAKLEQSLVTSAATAESIESEACEILGVKALRDYFRKSFFADHLKRYSKSRRQAPVYWPLSTASGSYTVWLYYHRFAKDTLYRVQELANDKLAFEDRQLTNLRQESGPNPSAGQRKQLAEKEAFVQELREFRTEIARVAPLWNPDLNDGVIINFATLWRLIAHRPWQKAVKECWDALVASDYDWAHLALHLWPERVVPKCQTDRSLAIAHNLDTVFWEEDEKGKWKAKKVAKAEFDRLIAGRTSPALKDALKSLMEAPVAGGGKKRKRE